MRLSKVPWRVEAHPIAKWLTAPNNVIWSRIHLSTVAADHDRSLSQSIVLQSQLPTGPLRDSGRPSGSISLSSKLTASSKNLPVSCPGCGALTQNVDPGSAGYYSLSRRAVKTYLRSLMREERQADSEDESRIEREQEPGPQLQDQEQQALENTSTEAEHRIPHLFCDRCHYLIHDSRGVPVAHPSIEAIADSIAESPFARNHVYHVVDSFFFNFSVIT